MALAAAFIVSAVATPAGISGAVLLLPFQVSVLGTPSPAVTPTNLLYNVVSTPGALYRYRQQHQTGGRLALILITGTLPGVITGSVIRVELVPGPRIFDLMIAALLLPLGIWLAATRPARDHALAHRHRAGHRRHRRRLPRRPDAVPAPGHSDPPHRRHPRYRHCRALPVVGAGLKPPPPACWSAWQIRSFCAIRPEQTRPSRTLGARHPRRARLADDERAVAREQALRSPAGTAYVLGIAVGRGEPLAETAASG